MLLSRLVRAGQAILPDPRDAAQRFPVPSAVALLATVYLLALFRGDVAVPVAVYTWALPAFFTAFMASAAAGIAAEARGAGRLPGYVWQGCALAVVAVVFGLAVTLDLSAWLACAGSLVATVVAPFTRRHVAGNAFWRFNEVTWTCAALTLAGAGLVAAGIAVVFQMLHFLFEIKVPWEVMRDIDIVIFSLICPLAWLAQMPERFDEDFAAESPASFISDAINALVRYGLVWLVLAYAAIFHAYAVKIALVVAMPRGQVGWLVVAFACAAVATAVLAYPGRRANWLVALYWRWWVWLLPVPALLLAVAVGERIAQYGLTERRYMLVLLGLWMLVLSVLVGWRRSEELRGVFLSLLVLLAVAALGPFGMVGWSTRAQARLFATELTSAGAVVDGRVVADAAEILKSKSSEQRSLDARLYYLTYQDRLDRLRGLFAGSKDDPFATVGADQPWVRMSTLRGDPHVRGNKLGTAIALRLGLPSTRYEPPSPQTTEPKVFFDATAPYVLDDVAGRTVIGPLEFYQYTGPSTQTRKIDGGASGPLTVGLEGAVVSVGKNGSTIRFDLSQPGALADGLKPQGQSTGFRPAVRLSPPGAAGGVDLAIIHSAGTTDRRHFQRLSFFLILSR